MEAKRVSESTVQFSQEQLDMIDEGIALFERGEGMTAIEALDLARRRTTAWMNVPPQNLSA